MNKKLFFILVPFVLLYLIISFLRYIYDVKSLKNSLNLNIDKNEFIIKKEQYNYQALKEYGIWGLEKPKPKPKVESKTKPKPKPKAEKVTVAYNDFKYSICIGKRCYPLYAITKNYIVLDNVKDKKKPFLKLKKNDRLENRVEIQKIDIKNSKLTLFDINSSEIKNIKLFESDAKNYVFKKKEKK